MKKALPQRDDADKMEKHMFRVYDANDDGYVDFVEFMMIFYIMSDGSPEEVLAKIFRVFDVNSDGTISEKELKRLIKDMFMMIKEENPEEVKLSSMKDYILYLHICIFSILWFPISSLEIKCSHS